MSAPLEPRACLVEAVCFWEPQVLLLWPNTSFRCLIIALALFQAVKTPGSISHMKHLAASLHSLNHSWKGKDILCWILFLFPDIGNFWWICSQFCPFTYDYSAFFTDGFGQGAGLSDHSGALPNGDILWFCEGCNQNVEIPLMYLAGNWPLWCLWFNLVGFCDVHATWALQQVLQCQETQDIFAILGSALSSGLIPPQCQGKSRGARGVLHARRPQIMQILMISSSLVWD